MAEIYSYMEQNSIENLWVGHATDISDSLDCTSQIVYTNLSKLKLMGCIELKKHGSGTRKSTYHLLKRPDSYEYNLQRDKDEFNRGLKLPTKTERMENSINRLADRMDRLEGIVQWIQRSMRHADAQNAENSDK